MLDTTGARTTLRSRIVVAVRRVPTLLRRVEQDVIGLNYAGLVVATVFFAWSVTPSLLPRDWLFQGLISGLNAVIGYGVGCVIDWAFRRWVRPKLPWSPPSLRVQYAVKLTVLTLCILVAGYMLVLSADWQRQIYALMDMAGTTTSGYLRTGGLSLLVGMLVVAVYRALRTSVRLLAKLLSRWVRVPSKFAPTLGAALLVILIVTLVNGVATRASFAVANSAFSVRNDKVRAGAGRRKTPRRLSPETALIAIPGCDGIRHPDCAGVQPWPEWLPLDMLRRWLFREFARAWPNLPIAHRRSHPPNGWASTSRSEPSTPRN